MSNYVMTYELILDRRANKFLVERKEKTCLKK